MKNLSKKSKNKVIGIIMIYNCGDMIEETYKKLPKKALNKIIVVDDGSTDNSVKIAKSLGLDVYTHKHGGYGTNIKFGLKKAKELGADYAIEIHGDGQYDSSVIPAAIEKSKKYGFDLLLGSRFTNLKQAINDGMPLSRYLANLGLSFFDRLVLGVNLTEFHTGFRVYSRRLLEKISFEDTSENYLYSFEIICQIRYFNLKLGEIPMHCDYKSSHTSISIKKSIFYALGTFEVLGKYMLAKMGLKINIFNSKN